MQQAYGQPAPAHSQQNLVGVASQAMQTMAAMRTTRGGSHGKKKGMMGVGKFLGGI